MSKCTHLSTEIKVRGSYCESADVIDVFSRLQKIVSGYTSWLDGLLKAFQLPSAHFPNLDAEQLLDFMKVFVIFDILVLLLLPVDLWLAMQHT
jgi:hypothetical protein